MRALAVEYLYGTVSQDLLDWIGGTRTDAYILVPGMQAGITLVIVATRKRVTLLRSGIIVWVHTGHLGMQARDCSNSTFKGATMSGLHNHTS